MMSLNIYGEFMEHETEYLNSLKTIDPIKGMGAQFQAQDRGIYTPQVANEGNMYFSQSGFMSKQTRILNDLIGDKMKALNTEMKNAQINKDSEKAKRLKKSIDKTVRLSKMAKDLEYKKVLAIDNEDYEAAKIIKAELEKVKRNLMSASDLPNVRGSSSTQRNIHTPGSDIAGLTADQITDPSRQLLNSISQIEYDLRGIELNLEKPDPSKYLNQNFKINNTYDESIGNNIDDNFDRDDQNSRPNSNQMSMHYPASLNSMQTQSVRPREFAQQEYEPEEVYRTKRYDEIIVPMHDKSPIDFAKVKDENKNDTQGGEIEEEKVSPQDSSKIDVMKQYYSEETTKLLFTKKWQSKMKGLEGLIKEIPKSFKDHGIAAQEHAISIFFNFVKEKLSQLAELNLKLFEVILEQSKSNNLELKFESKKVTQMVIEVLDKKAIDIIKNKVLSGGYFDYNQISTFILNEKSYKNKSFITSDAHIVPRLELMLFMVETSENYTSKKIFPLKELLEYVINKLSHPKKEIRIKAQQIIVLMYQKSGWYALEGQISRSVPQNQLQYLVADIPEVKTLIRKKATNKASESLREALKAVKEASVSVQKIDEKKPKAKK